MFAKVVMHRTEVYAFYNVFLLSDMDMALDHIVPESLDWLHTDEGPE